MVHRESRASNATRGARPSYRIETTLLSCGRRTHRNAGTIIATSKSKSHRIDCQMLKILVVDESAERAEIVSDALRRQGHSVVGCVSSTALLDREVRAREPDIVLIDADSPSRDSLEHLIVLARDSARPIVMFARDERPEAIRAAVRAGVSMYVVEGIESARIDPIFDLAIAQFQQFQTLRAELEQARTQIAERKVIERAKGVLMKQRGWDEEQAFQSLRRMAMDRNLRLGDAARQVIAVADLLGAGEAAI
jgi:two-component system, response regulator / RNA-binding antiterminator